MATALANDFSFYEQTPAEARAGATLSTDQIQHIQNKLAMAATEKINIEDNPLNPMLAALQRAKLDGEIGAYRSMIIGHQSAVSEAYEEAEAIAQLQQQKVKMVNAYEAFRQNDKSRSVSAIVSPPSAHQS